MSRRFMVSPGFKNAGPAAQAAGRVLGACSVVLTQVRSVGAFVHSFTEANLNSQASLATEP